jgi:hypothetical protein
MTQGESIAHLIENELDESDTQDDKRTITEFDR